MKTPFTTSFLQRAYAAAKVSGHIFPAYAASEAALESNWNRSELSIKANNLFGAKTPVTRPIPQLCGVITMPTREFLQGAWVTVQASFLSYPGWTSSFTDRMHTLQLLAPEYPHYAEALAAKTGEEFVEEVSKSWSTDPLRAKKVIEIYQVHKEIFGEN